MAKGIIENRAQDLWYSKQRGQPASGRDPRASSSRFLASSESRGQNASMSAASFEDQLLLMGEVTRRFKAQGWDLIIVGGSALEFYTEGKYASGDIDVCRQQGQRPIPPAVEKEIMLAMGAVSTGTRRQWRINEIFIDLLGEIETAPQPIFRELTTPNGPVRLMPAEDVLVERTFIAYTRNPPDTVALDAARKMAAAAIQMGANFDWEKAMQIADSRDYQIGSELKGLVEESAALIGPANEVQERTTP